MKTSRYNEISRARAFYRGISSAFLVSMLSFSAAENSTPSSTADSSFSSSFSSSSSSSSFSSSSARSFSIDYSRDTFIKDGVPFHYVGGSLHYWRVPPSYWLDRLQKMANCGLDVVTTYVHWALHEPTPGNFNFEVRVWGNLGI